MGALTLGAYPYLSSPTPLQDWGVLSTHGWDGGMETARVGSILFLVRGTMVDDGIYTGMQNQNIRWYDGRSEVQLGSDTACLKVRFRDSQGPV